MKFKAAILEMVKLNGMKKLKDQFIQKGLVNVLKQMDITLKGLSKLYFPEIDQFVYIPEGEFLISINKEMINIGGYYLDSLFDIESPLYKNKKYAEIDIYPLNTSGIVENFDPWYELPEDKREDWCLNFLRNTNHIGLGIDSNLGIVGIEIEYFYFRSENNLVHDNVFQGLNDEDDGFLNLLKKFRNEESGK